MKKSLKSLSSNLVLLGFSIAFAFVVAELALGVLPQGFSGDARVQKLFCQFDPVLGWSKIPNFTGRHVTEEYSVTEAMNSKGLRGPEYSYSKPAGEFRILVLGDSFAEGRGVEFEEIFSEVLKADLNAAGRAGNGGRFYEVINTGTGGYSTGQELLFFEHEGRKYSPNLVILQFYYNDVWYDTQSQHRRGSKPLFHLGPDGRVSFESVTYPEEFVVAADGTAASSSFGARIRKWVRTHSHVYKLIRNGFPNIPYVSDIAVKLGFLKTSGRSLPNELNVWKKDYDEQTLRSWELTGALLAQLKESVAREGSELVVFVVPSWASIYGRDFKKARGYYKVGADLYPEKVNSVLKSLCEKNGIKFLDPTASMKEAAKAGHAKLYYKKDGHWTAAGHKVAGDFLAEYVRVYSSMTNPPGGVPEPRTRRTE